MKIDERLTLITLEIGKIFSKVDLSKEEEIYILSQMAVKKYLLANVTKEVYMDYIDNLYDEMEEQGNLLGYL